MSKIKKTALILAAVLLLSASLFLYWEGKLPFPDTLPEESMKRVQIHGVFFKEYIEYTPNMDTLARLLSAMEETTVTRGPKFETLDGDAYYLWLYAEGGNNPITVTVRQDGRCCVGSMGSNNRYYEGASDLYQQIRTITQTLSGENLWGK